MVKLILIGATCDLLFHKRLLSNPRIEIVGCVVDYNSSAGYSPDLFKNFLAENKIQEIFFEEISNYQSDLVLVTGYSKKIDIKYFGDTLALNLHGGKLPYWRGYYANIWAVLNGNDEVCYTLHKVEPSLDSGEIYYIFSEKINNTEFYYEANKRLKNLVADKLGEILQKVIDGKILPQVNDSKLGCYCTKYCPSDLIIRDWEQNSILIFNLYRIFVTPFGTGIYFRFKGEIYEIKEMKCPLDNPTYYGVPGVIVNIQDNALYIKTKDSYIEVTKLLLNKKTVVIDEVFKIGNRLN